MVLTQVGTSDWLVRLLGGFEIESYKGVVDVPLAAQRVVAFLALNRRVARRSSLGALIWPDLDDVRARANLRSALWRLGQVSSLVVATSATVRLADDVVVDLDGIDRTITNLQSGQGNGSLEPAALDLELLPGWDEPWVAFERERLRQRQLHLLDTMIAARLEEGRYGDSIDAAMRALRLDPYRESTHAALLRAHVAGGNRIAALTHFKQFATTMRSELGLSPSVELNKLVRELLR